MKIIFLGTPSFAVASLAALVDNGYDVVAVITTPDKPSGRGQQLHQSEVKKYALDKGLKILQPEKLKDKDFLAEVKSLQADLQIVVAFRMMPLELWNMPPLGTFNLHASLLPQYRGAAPINRAIMNGELQTGLTTFFLKHEIDTGTILLQDKVEIAPDETAGELHDTLMVQGAQLIIKTMQLIQSENYQPIEQEQLIDDSTVLKHAPKLFKDDCKIDFSKNVLELHNQVRGLSPHPTAFFEMQQSDGEIIPVKVYRASYELTPVVLTHALTTDGKTILKVSGKDGFLNILEIQLPGKKRMKTTELLRGFKFEDSWKIL